MANETPVLNAQYCLRLRCKEMFINTDKPFDLKDSRSGHYWCSNTQNILGPDGKVVDASDCKAGRNCYEAA